MRLLTSRGIAFLLSTVLLAGCSALNTFHAPTAVVAPGGLVVMPPAPATASTAPGVAPATPAVGAVTPAVGAVTPAVVPVRPTVGPEAPTPAPVLPAVPAPSSIPAPPPVPAPPPGSAVPDLEPLQTQLASFLADQSGTWGVYVLDLESGRSIGLNADEPFLTASTFKLPMALHILRQVERGKTSLDELLTYRRTRDYEEGTGSLQNSIEEGDRLPVRRLLELAITQSDNIATNMLLNRFGTVNVHAFMREMGGTVVRYDATRNGTTPREMARYMQLAAGRTVITTPALRKLLMDWLTSTVFDDRIVAGVPAGVRVAHKIGTLDGVVNDVGLVFGPKRSFVISVFSLDVDEDAGAEVIAELTARVYRFEQALTPP